MTQAAAKNGHEFWLKEIEETKKMERFKVNQKL